MEFSVPLAFCIGSNFWPHLAVAIQSACDHQSHLRFEVFYEREDALWMRRIENTVATSGGVVSFHAFDTSRVSGFREIDHLGLSTYFRLFLPELFPEAKRLIYLDSDLYFFSPLDPLMTMSLEGKVLAARPSCEKLLQEMCAARLKRSPEIPYLNAGVLVIDLEAWRVQSITEKAVQFIQEHPERLSFADQCAINHVLNGEFLFLNPEWNVSFSDWIDIRPEHILHASRPDLLNAIKAPKIVHFNGPLKPWHLMDPNPYRRNYVRTRCALEGSAFYMADDFWSSWPRFLFETAKKVLGFPVVLAQRFAKKIRNLVRGAIQ